MTQPLTPVKSSSLFDALLSSDGNVYFCNNNYYYYYNASCFPFFDSASGVAGFAGAIASNPIDVVKVRQVLVKLITVCYHSSYFSKRDSETYM